jgi:hypothetical protein
MKLEVFRGVVNRLLAAAAAVRKVRQAGGPTTAATASTVISIRLHTAAVYLSISISAGWR